MMVELHKDYVDATEEYGKNTHNLITQETILFRFLQVLLADFCIWDKAKYETGLLKGLIFDGINITTI